MRVLVTGVDGFVGPHLVAALRASDHAVIGTALAPQRVEELAIPLHELDVTDEEACQRVVKAADPTHVVHLAAIGSVGWSFEHPEETHRVNVEGTQNLLEAVVALDRPTLRVLCIGSADEYGKNDGQPIVECPASDLTPFSPYGESKVVVEQIVEHDPRFRSCVVRTRSFPHFGPGQRLGFLSGDVCSQLVKMELGLQPPVLRVGNLAAVRDYMDVRDVVRAYLLLLERGTPGEVYNVASARGQTLRELVEEFVRLSGIAAQVETDASMVRPAEVPVLIGDSTKLRAATGWEPAMIREQTLRDTLAWWRAALQPAGAAARPSRARPAARSGRSSRS